ncbi:hypothetical protein [Acidimangrovimonas sediminis]|uniref:hypothetical protein n=1 Tax=Acidimangrovimonas sediminis TaxID=2056283 RepID=UPI000C7F909C|nr:hypothetical protein [Acidimangrovimonas sediminis]
MTVHQSARAQSAIEKASARFQAAVVSIAEKEQKAHLKRRGHVLQAFGKWLDSASRAETEQFLDTLAQAASAVDRKRIADYLANLPASVDGVEPMIATEQRTASPESEKRPVQAQQKD